MDLFKKLCNSFTAPGKEQEVAGVIKEYLDEKADDIYTDNLGNLIVRIGDEGENKEKTAVFASIDAPGLVVTYIEENGKVRVSPLGNCDYRSASCSAVTDGHISGILVPDNKEAESVDKSHVDFGFSDSKEAKGNLSEGDVLFFGNRVVNLQNALFAGAGLGMKAVVTAVCLASEKIKKSDDKCLYLVFSTQSLLNNRGAYPACFGVNCSKALCVSTFSGKGFGVKVLDKSLVCDRELTDIVYKASKKVTDNVEKVVSSTEMSDAGKVQSAKAGVRTASVMLPVKNLGSLVETVSQKDICTLSDIIAEALNNI